jgi:predicted transcriptional regulator
MAKNRDNARAEEVIQFRIPADLKRRYQEHCDARHETLSSWMCGALADRFGRERFYQKAAAVEEDFQRQMREANAKVVSAE